MVRSLSHYTRPVGHEVDEGMEAATKGEGKESVRSRLHGLPTRHIRSLGSTVPHSLRSLSGPFVPESLFHL